MNPLADLLRHTLAERAHDVLGVALQPAPVRRGGRFGSRWRAGIVGVLVLVLAAAAVVVAVALVAPSHPADHHAVAPPTVTPPPAGTQWVSYHGLTMTVPDTWQTGYFTCDRPTRSAVVVAPSDSVAVQSCPAFGPTPVLPAGTVTVTIGPIESTTSTPDGDPVTIAGHAARRQSLAPTGTTPAATRIEIADLDAMITVAGPDRASEQQVLDTVTDTPVDPNGCAAKLTTDPTPTTLPPGRLQPVAAASGAMCAYDASRRALVGSRVMTADDLHALASTVTAVVPWSTPPDGQSVGFGLVVYQLRRDNGATQTYAAQGGHVITVTDGTHLAQIPFDAPLPIPDVYAH